MSSTFYSDVTAALQVHQITEHIEPMLHDAMQMEEHTSNGDPTDVEVMSSVELIVEEIYDLPPHCGTNLVFCTVICGGHSIRTNMQVPESNKVKFDQRLNLNLAMRRNSEGFYTPEVQYIIVDLYIRYNHDKSKAEEFVGRVMMPVLLLTSNKQSLEGSAGAKSDRATVNHPNLKYQVSLATPPEDFIGWTGAQLSSLENMQYNIILNGNIVPFPGSFETVELYVPDVKAELCDEMFPADVILTNFRLVVLALKEEHRHLSNWTSFPNILDIAKSTDQPKQRCYIVKCADCRTVKIYVPAMTRRQKIRKHMEEKFSVVGKQQGEDKLVMEMKTPAKREEPIKRHTTISAYLSAENICSSDGEANEVNTEGISDEDILGNDLFASRTAARSVSPQRLYNTDIHTLRQMEFPVDELSDDDMFDVPNIKFKVTDYSDGESVDSLDVLEDQPRSRMFTGTSVSSFTSFTSYLGDYGSPRASKSSKSKMDAEELRNRPKRSFHLKKVQMEALRRRVRHHHCNSTISAPSYFLLKEIPVGTRCGFTRYNLDQEHNRQGDMSGWTKVDNTDYKHCKSYPPLFYVPVKASPTLNNVIQFRSKGRIPALSWLNNSGAILMRSAQPRTGILQKNCKDDERFLDSVRTQSRSKNGKDLPFMIFDARSKIAAKGNQMKGKGMENVANYENTKLNFLDMANIHAIRDSFEKVTALCNSPSNSKWETRMEQSQWLLHVQSVVRGAYFVSQHLVAGGAALVHCSDGWDRTSQLTSLSLLLVDPYYRTYSGFQVLVEREWLSFGHRFHDRLGKAHPSQKSPIFLLFLDAVHQILVQFPDVFEFTPEFLIVLCDLFSSDWTTTFLRNCPQERSSADRLQLWDVLDGMRPNLTNDRYYLNTNPIIPRVSLRHMVLWREYFLRFDWWRETLAEDRQGPVVWVADKDVQNCHLCHEKFSALKFKRKHHCRSCGNIFCGNCASKRICIPLKNFTTPVLVCDKCYQEHTTSP